MSDHQGTSMDRKMDVPAKMQCTKQRETCLDVNRPWAPGNSSDIRPLYDTQRQSWRHTNAAHRAHAGRRQKGLRRLFQQVITVGKGDILDTDKPCDLSVEDLVRVCVNLPPDASTVAAVSSALIYLDSRALAAFMKELAKSQQLVRAMELFDWLKALPVDHELYGLCDLYTFTTAISLMGMSQQLRKALELVGEMRARGLQCNVHTYSALMNVCIKCDACDLALDVFNQMHEDKIKPNVVTYNTLVDVYGKTGQWDKAVRVLADMREQGLEPEVRTYNTAIIACNMCGQPQEALKVYQKLLDAGLQPISTTYTALISAYGKAGHLDKALETFQTMIHQGCERGVITYSALISGCEKAGRWELALQLFDQMQREGCAPNTVTYNSLITACQQGGQFDKACEVFEQMKHHGCRPDAVTFTALISAYSKAGQWHKSVQVFEQMQQQHCKPDSLVYQTVIDSLWQSGVCWAQARAWQLYTAAVRTWQYRFTVHQGSCTSQQELELVVPACSPGVGVLALRKWLGDMVAQAESDITLLAGLAGGRMLLSLGRSRHMKEPGSNAACQALLAVLNGFKSPFRPGTGGTGTGGNSVVVAEAPIAAVLEWLKSNELPEHLALLMDPVAASSKQPNLPGLGHKRISLQPEIAEDAKLEDSCVRAFQTVKDFERGQHLQPANMSQEYLAQRGACIAAAFKLSEQLELVEEVAFDAVLLMDRVMSTGAAYDSSMSMLMVTAALRTAALQTIPSSNQAAGDCVPGDALLSAAAGFPAGSVTKMEGEMTAALAGDTKTISMMRCTKLYLERLGLDRQDTPGNVHMMKGIMRLLQMAQLEQVLLPIRPSIVAAAVLMCARAAVGCHPFWPHCLGQLTGLSPAGDTQLASAVAIVEPLAALAGLDPPPHPTQGSPCHVNLASVSAMAASSRASAIGQSFCQLAPALVGVGSGYSTPASQASTPTAAMAQAVQFPARNLLDAVVRRHSLQRQGSDMSSLSAHDCSEGSVGDLQSLMTSSAAATAAAVAAAGTAVGSPGAQPVPPLLNPNEPGLMAAMAGLQLGMAWQHNTVNPDWHQSTLASWGNRGGLYGPDGFQSVQQHLPGSRLQHMTSPYFLPQQQAFMVNSAEQLLH